MEDTELGALKTLLLLLELERPGLEPFLPRLESLGERPGLDAIMEDVMKTKRIVTMPAYRNEADLLRLMVLALAPREEWTLYSPGPGVWSWAVDMLESHRNTL